MSTQLLCTFCSTSSIEATLEQIKNTYDIAFGTIYVLENHVAQEGVHNDNSELCCTYNVKLGSPVNGKIPEATISLHRKKATNTLYTINALNLLVAELNGGVVDKTFQINWDDYRNTILVTAHNRLKKINTKLHKIVRI
jgi:hypothetical protein